jgi:hypothetical protein
LEGRVESIIALASAMLRNTFVSGYVSLFYASGSQPLQLWRVVNPAEQQQQHQQHQQQLGQAAIRTVTDEELKSPVLELGDPSVLLRIECPAAPHETLGIRGMPFLVLQAKNVGSFFSFEVELLDDAKKTRRFRCSTFQVETKVREGICTLPLVLAAGWNTIQLDLPKMLHQAYGTQLVELSGLVVHANTRLRRIYLAEKLCSEENLPAELKMYKM